jgi:mRNA interferase RelE/StbE
LVWKIEFEESAKKELSKLDKQTAKRIIDFIKERLSSIDNPRNLGKRLKGSKSGDFWRYRIGDYRIICAIEDNSTKILVICVSHRKDVYD